MGDEIIQIVNENEKDDVDNKIEPHNSRDPHNAHNGKQITLVSLSPNGKYVITYSRDDYSIEGWIVKDSTLILDSQVNVFKLERLEYVKAIRVNDNKIVCLCFCNDIEIFQMLNEHRQIKFNPPLPLFVFPKIRFEKNGNLSILSFYNKIFIYSPHHDKTNDELTLMSFCLYNKAYYLYNKAVLGLFIDEDNNSIWTISQNDLFQWDLKTLQFKFNYSLGFTATRDESAILTVISKENSIVVKYCNEISIFLKEIYFPIRNIRLEGNNIKVELCTVQSNDYLLTFNLPDENKKDEKQNIMLYCITDINKQPIDASMIFNEDSKNDSKNEFILYEYNSESKEAYGLVNGKFSYINLSNLNWNKFFESQYDDYVSWNNYLSQFFATNYYNDASTFLEIENIKSLISEKREKIENIVDIPFKNQKYKWRIDREDGKLSVYSDEELLLSSTGTSLDNLWNCKILNNNALVLRYKSNIKIYKYDSSIKIQYEYDKYIDGRWILPLNLAHNEYLIETIESTIENDRCLAKYGATLLPILIDLPHPEITCYIEVIYNKCIKLVKEDPKRNFKFLNIIILSMNNLYEKYSDYVTKFNSEMFMILDFDEGIKFHPHFYTFSQEMEIKITDSHFYTFCQEMRIKITNSHFYKIIKITKNSKFFKFFQHLFLLYSFISNTFWRLTSGSKYVQCINLIVPYIDYSRYPLEYSWWKELFYPQSSVFTDTCKKEFYTNWNGEAIINFKWKTFGRTYYFIIWLIFMIFLICFTIASYPTNLITQETREIRIKLYQTTIAFGFFHLILELRQFVWNPKKYFLSIWNLFGKYII
jgi:hypothetical protein